LQRGLLGLQKIEKEREIEKVCVSKRWREREREREITCYAREQRTKEEAREGEVGGGERG